MTEEQQQQDKTTATQHSNNPLQMLNQWYQKNDYLQFRKMEAPKLIRFIYIVGTIWIVISAIGMILSGEGESGFGVGLLIFGTLALRVSCELLILGFRLNETLTEVKNLLEKDS